MCEGSCAYRAETKEQTRLVQTRKFLCPRCEQLEQLDTTNGHWSFTES